VSCVIMETIELLDSFTQIGSSSMSQRIKAVFQNGAFVPQQPCDLPEGSVVELTVYDPYTIPPAIKDRVQRAAMLQELVQRMRDNPIPEAAPSFTRDELHERR
jgi:predicted DNA-binding antitoxin AbrB/MazE fold protein